MTSARTKSGQVIAVLPMRESDVRAGGDWISILGKPLLDYTIDAAKAASRIDRIVVTTESKVVAARAQELGADAPFLRPAALAAPGVPLIEVLQHCVSELAAAREEPSIIVLLEVTHPVRPPGLIDSVIEAMRSEGLDTVFTAFESRHTYWQVAENGELTRVQNESENAPQAQRSPLFGQIQGLVCATTIATVRSGSVIGKRVAVVPVRGLLGFVDAKKEEGLRLAEFLIQRS